MERLTKRFERVVCYIGKNKQNDEDTAAEMSVPAIRDVLGKLAEYEDTGLPPEICDAYKTFEDEAISKNVPFSRIVKLMNAEAEGRLLVLPCALEQWAWYVMDGQVYCEKVYDVSYGKASSGKNVLFYSCEYGFDFTGDQWGKTVFGTEEEAVAALRCTGFETQKG